MTLGYDKPLYMLAFDHRGSFQKSLLGIEGVPNAAEADRISDAKRILYEAFELVIQNGVERNSAGLLVDEEFGADVALRAKGAGVALAMPVEKSGQEEFDFEFGDDFGAHIERFDPTFAKVLVRYNPYGDPALNRRQACRLSTLSNWLHERGRKLLFELLVPATPEPTASRASCSAAEPTRPGSCIGLSRGPGFRATSASRSGARCGGTSSPSTSRGASSATRRRGASRATTSA